MFAMLAFRIVAAIAAMQIFLVTVVWPDAHALLGLLLGAAAGAIIFGVGRAVLEQQGLRDPSASGRPEQAEVARRAESLLLLASAGAFVSVAALFFVLRGPAAGAPWGFVAGLAAGLVATFVGSTRLNRLAADHGAPERSEG